MPYTEISKNEARQRYEDGKIVRLMASKLNPHSYWGEPLPVKLSHKNQTFQALCNEFAYYNCTKETGKTIKFYIIEGVD